MQQVYHPNAVTNIHIRRQIKESSLTNVELAQTFHTSPATISKWKNRETCEDKSSRPHQIVYALNELEESLVVPNGMEFTNRLIKSKKRELCQKPSKLDEVCKGNHIEHRLTQPNL